jgi:hypothetical protein
MIDCFQLQQITNKESQMKRVADLIHGDRVYHQDRGSLVTIDEVTTMFFARLPDLENGGLHARREKSTLLVQVLERGENMNLRPDFILFEEGEENLWDRGGAIFRWETGPACSGCDLAGQMMRCNNGLYCDHRGEGSWKISEKQLDSQD